MKKKINQANSTCSGKFVDNVINTNPVGKCVPIMFVTAGASPVELTYEELYVWLFTRCIASWCFLPIITSTGLSWIARLIELDDNYFSQPDISN